MKYELLFFSVLFSILLMSCTSEEHTSYQKLKAENQSLRDSLAMFQQLSTMKSEAIVELERMNIVYRGVENHVKIAVPNALNFSVMAPGLKLKENGHYVLRPTTGNEVTFHIVAEMRNGEQLKFEKVFRIHEIGSGRIAVNDIKYKDDLIRLTKNDIKKSYFSLYIGNYLPYKLQKVIGFTVLFPKRKNVIVNGNSFSEKAQKTLDEMSIGDTIYISSVKGYVSSNARICKITPLGIEIKD
ncbi:GldM family protein [Kordia algicida OT-1]|nr:GldM family protein [Kordia algicida]